MAVTIAEAALEKKKRIQARQSLEQHILWRQDEHKPAKHHKLLIAKLELLEKRAIKKLMILMPPGSGKSWYASVEFPVWYLGRHPDHNVVAASHTGELAEHFGRRARNIVADPEFQKLWGSTLAGDSQAAGRWAMDKGGQYFAVGVGGSVTGRRSSLSIIDDPVSGAADADSASVREKTWNWYIQDFKTRLKPDAVQLLIQTRWNMDDLAGRLLASEPDEWEVISLPMEAIAGDPLGRKLGERLWSDYFTEEMVASAKKDLRTWNALYQQNPVPDEGVFFKREWFRFYDIAPSAGMYKYLSSDFGVTEAGGDATEIGIHGLAHTGDLYLCLDGWGGHTSPDKWIDEYLNLVAKHKTLCEFNEAGVIRRSIEPFLINRRRERRIFGRCEWLAPIGDKMARARSLQGMAAQGKVLLPNNEYGRRVLADLIRFPNSADDHTVDMCALMARALEEAFPGVMTKQPEKKKVDRWEEAFADMDAENDDNWKLA